MAAKGAVTIHNSTFSNNRSGSRSGFETITATGSSSFTIRNSIIFGNSPLDCHGRLATNSGNIIGTGNCGTPYSTADPLLGSWVSPADGSPGYFPLQAGSPAIDAVSCITGITTDIRGTSRPQGSNCDIGAYEYDSSTPPPTVDPNITATPTVAPSATAAPQNLTVSSTGLISWSTASGATHYELETYETDGYYNISYQINAVTHPDYYYLPSTQTSVQLRSSPVQSGQSVYSNFRIRVRALTSTSQSAWVYYPSETTTVTLDLSSQNIPTHSNSLACPSNVQFSWNWDDGKLHLTVSQDQLPNVMYYEADILYRDSNDNYAGGAVLAPVDQFAIPQDNRLITDFDTDYIRYEVTVSYVSSSSLKPMCQVGSNLREDHLTFTQDDIPAPPPPPPPAPTNLSVSGITTTSLTLNWDAVTDATNYKVFLDGAEQPLSVQGTSHTFTSLTPGTSYTLGVAAVGAGGTSATASIGASTSSTTSPPAPTNLSVSGITTTSLTLNWDAVTGATNYKVFLDGAELPLNVQGTSHSFTSLTPGTSYTLGVAAVGAGGTSATASIGASTSSTTSPPAPTNLSVSGITTTSLTLNWDAVTGATNYKVYLDGAEQPLNVGGTSHSFTSLTPGRSYTLGVAAVGAGGTSGIASLSASTSATTPVPTDTPGGRVLFKLGSFEVTYSMIFGSGDPVGDYHPGFTEEGLSDLIDEMGILVGSGWRAASELGKYITAQYMCFSFSTIGEVLVDQGGIDLATNLLFDLNFWRVLGGIKGFLAGGKSGAVAGSTIPGIGTAAGGASVGAASAYIGPELAARMFTLAFSQALKTQKTHIVKSATSFLNSVLEEDDAKKKALELAFDVAGVGASIVVDIVADALFETLVKYLERAAISFKSGTNWWTPNRILHYASQEFPKQLLKAATDVNVYVKAAGLNIAEFGVTKWLESIVEDSVEWLTSTFIDCDSLEPVQKIRQNVNQFLTALGDGAEIIIEELGDDLRYWIWVIKDKINTLNKLIDQLRQMDSFNIQDIHGSICAVPEFKTMFPISVFCNPVVERLMVDAICLFGADMSDVTDDEGNTLRTLDCDELKNQYPEPVENFLVTSKYLTKWTCSKVGAVVPSSCAVAVGIQIFASPGQGWKEYIVRGNSLQLNSKHLPPSASGFQIRIRALNGSIASDPVLYPADPNDPTQFAAAPAIIVHENVPAPPAEDSDDRDDSGAAATSIPQAEPPASTCENLPPHLRVQHYHHSTQCNVLSRASVGHPDLVGNFIAGVDIWGYVGAVVEVCIQGSGPLRFVDTSEMPRSVRPLPAFSDGGLTCAWVERVGQVILVPGPPSPPKLKPATPGPATQALSNCMVTLEYVLNFRQGPGGPIRKTADGRDFWLPALVSLTALERTADWFYVDYHGERGWISADFVIERGDCQANAATLPTALPAWEPSPLPANPTAPAPDVTPVGMR